MGADLAGTSSLHISPSFSAFFFSFDNVIFTKWKLLKKKRLAVMAVCGQTDSQASFLASTHKSQEKKTFSRLHILYFIG